MPAMTANPNAHRDAGLTVSRRAAVFAGLGVWLVGIPLAHGALPWAISLLANRNGWDQGGPGPWNLAGLLLVALGLTGLAWVFLAGFRCISELPARVKLGLAPVILLRNGPFARSRNPMYLSALTLWLGWAVFYGSFTVVSAWLGIWTLVNFVVVPREERSLERCFGERYRQYRQKVPRWFDLGRRNRGRIPTPKQSAHE